MATVKQKRIAKLLIENETLDKPLNGGQMLAKVGYAKSMHKAKVNDVLESEGVRDALAEYGFNEDNAKKVVTDILMDEERDANARLKASDMVFKVFGTYAAEKRTTLNVNVEADIKDDSQLNAIREEFENKIKANLIANE